MQKSHPKYKIKKGDTIQIISNLFGVEKDIWVRYHNNMCRLEHIIRKSLPKGLLEIYLLPELERFANSNTNLEAIAVISPSELKQKELTNWAIFLRSNSLNHSYWFRYIFEDDKSTTEIRYKVLVRYLQEETEETDLYLIHRISNVYINDELPGLCMDELAYETGKVFYPMVVEVNKRGEWVSLRNYEQIKNNWFSNIRPYVELRYGGDVGIKYLIKMDEVLNSKEKIEEVFKNDLFYKIYFNTVYENYSLLFEINKILDFIIDGGRPLSFDTHYKLNREVTSNGYKEIIQKGVGVEKLYGQDELIPNESNNYSARILLEMKTNYIREFTAKWNLKNNERNIKLILYPLRQQCDEEFKIKLDKPQKKK